LKHALVKALAAKTLPPIQAIDINFRLLICLEKSNAFLYFNLLAVR